MSSTFTRLFRYAKAVGAEAKENYTTEALRACIATDARPLALALRAAGIVDVGESAVRRVDTQVSIGGVGQIDLIAAFDDGPELWFEVKVDAGESGDQLPRYGRFIETTADELRPKLIILGPAPLGDGLAWLSWQELRAAIVASGTTSPYWHDFKTYLEEIRMADNHDEPVSADEAKTLQGGRSLFGKATRILTPFAREAVALWPGSVWPATEAKVSNALAASFLSHSTLTIANATNLRANVSAGLYHEPLTESAWLGLWIWCRPNRVAERQAILEFTKQLASPEWFTDRGAWELFGAYRELVPLSNEEATAWLRARLAQLKEAGILEALPRLGTEDR